MLIYKIIFIYNKFNLLYKNILIYEFNFIRFFL